MKTAILITGQARTFDQVFEGLCYFVFRKLEDPHFFVSVSNDADAGKVERLKRKYPDRVTFEYVDQPMVPEPPMQSTLHAPYAITPTKTPNVGPLQGICRQLWHLSRGYRFAMLTGAGKATTFVRCRPDLHFHRFDFKGTIQTNQALTPWWGNFGGVNDRFAILGANAAKAYFSTWDKVPELLAMGCPFHPESLVAASMESENIDIQRKLIAEFAFKRPNNQLEHMNVLHGEMAPRGE